MPPARHLLLLTPAIPPDPITAAARAGRMLKYLPEHGYEIDVVTQGQTSTITSGVWRVGPRPGAAPAPLLSRLGYLLKRLLPHDDQLAWAAHVYATAASLSSRRHYDAVISTAPPMGIHIAAILLKKKTGVPVLCDFRDPLVGNPFRAPDVLFPHDRLMESFVARHADAVICNTDTAWEEFRMRHRGHAGKCYLVWNGFDPDEQRAQEAGDSGELRTVAHVGTLYGGRDPRPLLASVRRLASSGRLRPGMARFLLAGPIQAEMKARLEEDFATLLDGGFLEIDNREIPRAEADRIARSAGSSLIVDTNNRGVSVQVPAKLFTSILLGKPLLALTYEGSTTEGVLGRSGLNYRCIDPRWEPGRIDAQLDEFLGLPVTAVAPSQWFLQTFDGRRQVCEVARILDGCIMGANRNRVAQASL